MNRAHRARPRQHTLNPHPRVHEIKLALRQLDVHVARMLDPGDEQLLAAAAALASAALVGREDAA